MLAKDGYARRVETIIADRNHLGTPRRQWYTVGQQKDLRAMAAWLDEQAARETTEVTA